jgi:hypothetical protein
MELSDDSMRSTKDIRVEKVVLEYEGKEINIVDIFEDFIIYEDIFSPYMSANISITDSRNISELFSLKGGERISIRFKNAGFKQSVELDFYIDTVSERMMTKNKNSVFVIYLVTQEKIYDSIRKVSRSYKDDYYNVYIDEVIKSDIYGLSSTKKFESEQSLYNTNIVIPYWNPFKAIKWMSKRCVSPLYHGSPYLFFENKQGFNLFSMEYMFNRPAKYSYVYSPKVEYKNRNVLNDFFKIETYYMKQSINFLDRLQEGCFTSKLYSFDLTTKKFENYSYRYIEENDTIFKNVRGNTYTPRIDIAYKNSELELTNNYVETWYPTYYSNLKNSENISLEIEIAGNLLLNVGDKIEILIPSYAASEQIVEDKILSGNYLVTAICHNINKKKYECKIEVYKDGFNRPIEGTKTTEIA